MTQTPSFPVSSAILDLCRRAAFARGLLGRDNAAIYRRMAEFAADLPATGTLFNAFFAPTPADDATPPPTLEEIGDAYWNGNGGSLVEKRRTGSFYTPAAVIDRVLAPVVARFVRERRLHEIVCDPAIGCGFFHLRLVHLLAASGRFNPAVIARWATENLYGIDIDAGAVFLARTFLWLTLSTPDREYPPAPGRFVTGDALLGPAFGQEPSAAVPGVAVDWQRTFPSVAATGGFDAVIGNPPYEVLTNFGRHPERRILADSLRSGGLYRDALGSQINLYRCFIERSLQVLAPGGTLAFVVPMSLARDRAAAPLRRRLLCHEGAGEWTFFSEKDRLFPGVTQSLCIFSATRSAGPVPTVTLVTGGVATSLPTDILDDELRLPDLDHDGIRLYRWLHDNCPGRIGDAANMRVGEVDQTVFRECMVDTDTGCLLARGCHLRPFILDTSDGGEQRYLRLDRFLAMKGGAGPACRDRAARPRVVQLGIRNLQSRPRLVAAIAPTGVYLGNSLNVYFPHDNVDSRFLAGVLNSRLLDWLFRATSGNNNVNLYEMARLPFPHPCDAGRAGAVAAAYERCVATALTGGNVEEARLVLDSAVEACYGIPEELRAYMV